MDVGVQGGGMWAGRLLNENRVEVQTLSGCREHLDSLKKERKKKRKKEEKKTKIFLVSATEVFFVH